MPIPKPSASEDQNKFISRCMSELASEYDDNKQRYAICESSWENKFAVQKFLREKHLHELNRFSNSVNAIRYIDLTFAEGVPHYTKDGVLYEGPTHKGPDGRLMTGKIHTADSEYLYHLEDLPSK